MTLRRKWFDSKLFSEKRVAAKRGQIKATGGARLTTGPPSGGVSVSGSAPVGDAPGEPAFLLSAHEAFYDTITATTVESAAVMPNTGSWRGLGKFVP